VVAAPSKKSLDSPDTHIDVPGITADVVEVADSTVSRLVFQVGTHCPQISQEGKPLCFAHHTGYVVDGTLHVEMQDGSVIEPGRHDVFDIPPGHDGWAVGNRPFVALNWAGFRTWLPERTGERVLVTLVFTDIVGSTERAVAVGDQGWRDLLGEHRRAVRVVLDRFRGREIATTGDGFLAVFDGAARGIDAALAIRDRSNRDGLSIRAGVHSGEVEVVGEDLRGVSVHEAARICAAAGPDEVFVSEATALLVGRGLFAFEDRGRHQLKGLPGERHLFAAEHAAAAST
jgi:class 3 adenylate cyclase